MGSITSILASEAQSIAKVEQGGYLHDLVEEYFRILRPAENLNVDDLNEEQRTARKALWSLGMMDIHFAAKDYIAHRPLPLDLSDEKKHKFKLEELDRWIKLNEHQGNILWYSKDRSRADKLLGLAIDLARDIPVEGNWIKKALEYVDADKNSTYSVSTEDLRSLEDLVDSKEPSAAGSLTRHRSQFIGDSVEGAVEGNDIDQKEWPEACKTMTRMTELASTIYHSPDTKDPDKWLEAFKSSFSTDGA
ncbi:hypothetical protein NCC49_006112 [Naganishia albida]|nr:hypothetical protein NCC49_006112 [Naganishia albida]